MEGRSRRTSRRERPMNSRAGSFRRRGNAPPSHGVARAAAVLIAARDAAAAAEGFRGPPGFSPRRRRPALSRFLTRRIVRRRKWRRLRGRGPRERIDDFPAARLFWGCCRPLCAGPRGRDRLHRAGLRAARRFGIYCYFGGRRLRWRIAGARPELWGF